MCPYWYANCCQHTHTVAAIDTHTHTHTLVQTYTCVGCEYAHTCRFNNAYASVNRRQKPQSQQFWEFRELRVALCTPPWGTVTTIEELTPSDSVFPASFQFSFPAPCTPCSVFSFSRRPSIFEESARWILARLPKCKLSTPVFNVYWRWQQKQLKCD